MVKYDKKERSISYLLWKYRNGVKQPSEVWSTERETEKKRDYRFKQKIFEYDIYNTNHFLQGTQKERMEYILENYTFDKMGNYKNSQILPMLMIYVKLEHRPYHNLSTYSIFAKEHGITEQMFINFLNKLSAYHWSISNLHRISHNDEWADRKLKFDSILNGDYFESKRLRMERVVNYFVFDRVCYNHDTNKQVLFEEYNKTHFLKGESVDRMRLLLDKLDKDKFLEYTDEQIVQMLMLSIKLEDGNAKYSKYKYFMDKYDISESVFIQFLVKLNMTYVSHRYDPRPHLSPMSCND